MSPRLIMTIKEAILKSMEEMGGLVSSRQVFQHIVKNAYYDVSRWTQSTPASVVASSMGGFIRDNDARVKRIKKDNLYLYYLAKNEQDIDTDHVNVKPGRHLAPDRESSKTENYKERDLHLLLSTYLDNSNVYSKTIFHEKSNREDDNQTWTHPDMIGIKFLKLQTTATRAFLKAINQVETFKLYSYELKREITSDSELKKAYFQAFSNSSWANYGYLVAFEISDSLSDEMERLNHSFGIGIIALGANPFKSKILFQARYKSLDFKTIDKLCNINPEFAKFIEHSERLLTADDKYYKAIEKEFTETCDGILKNDSDIEKYCKEKHIPLEEEDFHD
jgi:hypothetical protein